MFFNCKLKYFYAAVMMSSVIFSGCGLKIGEVNKTKETAEVQSIACLDSTIADLKLFFAGQASDDQVAQSLQCLQDVFISFKENIRGENKDAYTAKEIAIFIEKNFIQDGTTFSDSFLKELMNFKVAMMGGTNQLFLKSEIDKIVNLLTLIKPDLVSLNKSMKIISFTWTKEFQPTDGDEKERQFLQAKSNFNKLIQKLSAEFSKTNNAYQMDDLINFSKEILILGKSDRKILETIEKARPFVKKFKILLIGGDFSLATTEWNRLGSAMNEGLFQVLRYQYFLKDLKDTDTDIKWNGYEKIAMDLSGLVENLLDAKETPILSNFDLFELSQSMDQIFPQTVLSLSLIDSIGYLKVMILGDSPSGRIGWSKLDFAKLREKIPQLFSHFVVLVKTNEYLQKNKAHVGLQQTNQQEFELVEAKAMATIQQLSEMIEKPYNIYYMKVLIQELSRGIFKESLILPDNFESLFKVVLSAKTIMTGEEDNNIAVDNLKLLLKVGAQTYLNFNEYEIFLSPLQSDQAQFYMPFERLFDKALNTLALNLQLKSTKVFTSQELIQFIITLQSEKIISTKLTAETLRQMFFGLWNNVLISPEDRLANKPIAGFDQKALAQIRFEIGMFLKTQKKISKIFETGALFTQVQLKKEIQGQIKETTDQQTLIGLKEILELVSTGLPLNLNKDGLLKILTPEVGLYNFKDLLQSNIARTVSRVFIRSYAGDLVRATKLVGVTEAEAEVAFQQFRAIGIETQLIEPENKSFMASRFMEANMFLATSNGDEFVNFGELHQLIIHIVSGMKRAEILKSKIIKLCLPPQQGVITPRTAVWEDCLLKLYFTESQAYAELPQFSLLKKQFTETENKDYYLSLLKAIGHVPNDKKVVYFVDADLFPHVVQYVEMVYARHDLNQDMVLDKCEALKAFPIYHDLIKQLTLEYKLSEKQLPGVFIYLLKFGRPPKSPAELFKFIGFINNPNKWDVQATRIDLGKIFNFIGESIKQKPLPALQPFGATHEFYENPLPPKPENPVVTGCEQL